MYADGLYEVFIGTPEYYLHMIYLALDFGAENDALAVLGILQSQTHGTLYPVALATAVFDIGLLLEFLPDGTRDVLAALQMLLLLVSIFYLDII